MSNIDLAEISLAAPSVEKADSDAVDVLLPCIDCGDQFTWTAGEQTFFREKNLLNPPKRCKECKKAKNRRLAAIELAKATGKPHKIEVSAQCAKCQQKTTVPFYPSQGRPVYCRDCFQSMKTQGNGNYL